jgi:hypothetical protein
MSTFAWFPPRISRKAAKVQRARKKVFWGCATAMVFALLAGAGTAEIKSEQAKIGWNAESGQAVLTNGQLELVVETKSGINARSLRDVKTGQVFADRDYAWNLGGTVGLPKLEAAPVISSGKDGSRSIVFKGRLGAIGVEQMFTLPGDQPGVVLEQISISNPTDKAVETAGFYCGFAKCLREGEAWTADAGEVRFCPVPYRRETNGAMQEFPLREVVEHGTTYGGWMEPQKATPIWGAEGWVWSQGNASFLIAKCNQQGMEWSLMEPMKRGNETVLRFGGAGQWKYNHPEGATKLEPGKSYQFGETLLQAVDGDWKQAYYAYRSYFNSKNCGTPKGYDPPVQWNELYNNEYFGRMGGLWNEFLASSKPLFSSEYDARNEKLLHEYYSLKLIKAEADKAKELGCQALYLDPGWEIGMSRQIWDAERLGPMPEFVKMLREEYGMRGVCFWCSLAGVPPTYNDTSACPKGTQTLDKDGKPAPYLLCLPSAGFLDTKEQNLLELARNGAIFFMFDSNQFSGPCYDKTHGHAIPSTREEHAKALFELARRVKVKYPHVLIEMHDPITGPSNIHYTPSYFGYNPPLSHDCLWGHEFMWNSMDDLLSRRAVSLYYYNLAYGIPLYLHVGLNTDNENALVFWWYASTCRHLGVGGKSPNPAVWAAQKKAMQAYLPLQQFFKRGQFYGLDEMVHAHTLAEQRESVLNVFNLEEKPTEKEVRFRLADVGLPAGSIKIDGAPFTVNGGEITMKLSIPAHGHQLVKVKSL